ncbi:50S ribosomal protein L11 methyltransferase [Campylobacter iguaniorum]|uniref:Ribosomal protein L11 methyltransferase n=1 Tax=Campylobacter iguaniorum TaxID=1244531 RepID=A0A076FH81_9BACT|nr:50S ribosomal protein L11 methyltransferase [Campylobacter iguaniorum]AII15184.1 50S ribosomal protein L11 methyltransferase [Campylobacter iguaniorum]ALV25109.1 50S ribosomal protein L11 methyltransferase [Campylobacter iguaniorum]
MKEKFFELKVQSSHYEILKDFAFELGVTCVEELPDGFIIRDEDELEDIKWGLEEFAKKAKFDISTNIVQKDNIDWINEYKKGIKPLEVGKFYIRPSWEEPKNGLIDIIIDPALAFGSGHHESTNSCLNLISKFISTNQNLSAVDVGCGSGILSIALAKLGVSVDACDTDELAVLSSQENAQKNGVKFNQIWTGSITDADKKYDIVVANIIADVIFLLSKDLKNSINDNGYLILSGILTKYKDRILDTFKDLTLVENITLNEWESFIFKK